MIDGSLAIRPWLGDRAGVLPETKRRGEANLAAAARDAETFATAATGGRQRGFAAAVCALIGAVSLTTLPYAAKSTPTIPNFLALDQCAIFLVYCLTTWLFFAQHAATRAVSLLVLGAGSLFATLMVLGQLICFPNMLAPGLLLGMGAPTLTWLWTFWHLALPLSAIPFAIIEGDGHDRATPPGRTASVQVLVITAVSLLAAATVLAAARLVADLPVTADPDGGYWALTTSGIGPVLIAVTMLALAILCWTTRLRSVLQLWLAVSLFILLMDNLVTDLGAARDTAGWLIGRIEALLAGLVVVAVYLKELDYLYQRTRATAKAREAARAEAQAARESLEIVLEASGMGDWEVDLVTGLSRRTLRHDRIFGYSELQPAWDVARFLDHVHPEDRAAAAAAFTAAQADGTLDFECRIIAADDTTRWIAVKGRTYYDRSGSPVSMAGCVLDVTERRATHERLRRSERMEAIGQLTGGVAHDFNNLLTIILGNLDMIARKPADAGRVERLAKNAFTAGRRGTELTEKLLSFSRRQVVKPEVVNVNRLASDLLPLLRQAAGASIEIALELDAGIDPVRIDQGQFQAALLNIAGNARDAMPSGGQLRIATSNAASAERGGEEPADASSGGFVRLTVSDTGIGMDAATAARAFEPFFTTKEVGKGTGLGLSQVYGFARQAGGQCRITSAPGKGCAVDILLPRSGEPALQAGTASVLPLRRASGGEVVLIAEDEDALREMAAESLESLGYKTLTAPDARVALDVLRGPTRVDILFSDVVMPGGMNGAQLAVKAREIRPDLKVLLTSGYIATATGGSQTLPEGVPLLRKPYLREDLAEKLQALTVA